eukprot:5635525-Pyramimonas_sp.AAC.1
MESSQARFTRKARHAVPEFKQFVSEDLDWSDPAGFHSRMRSATVAQLRAQETDIENSEALNVSFKKAAER